MRLAGAAKAGYYPAHPDAVQLAIDRLKLADPTALTPILDPCAGKGDALWQLAKGLGVAPECIYAIELDHGRAEYLHSSGAVPDENILAPCSFEGTRISHGSFSFIWCNPPYDSELGGGRRLEYSFLQRATALLRPHGIMALVVPEYIANQYEVRNQFKTWYNRTAMIAFPMAHRKYREVIVLAEKRSRHRNEEEMLAASDWIKVTDDREPYIIPACDKPTNFLKVEYTEAELLAAIAKSPLQRLLQPPAETPLPSPPLALGTGHIALLLAAGHLDGIVRPEGERPHCVRGTANKVKYLASEEERENADGSVTSVQKWNEKIVLTVRAVDHTGTIHTFAQE